MIILMMKIWIEIWTIKNCWLFNFQWPIKWILRTNISYVNVIWTLLYTRLAYWAGFLTCLSSRGNNLKSFLLLLNAAEAANTHLMSLFNLHVSWKSIELTISKIEEEHALKRAMRTEYIYTHKNTPK